MDDSRKYLMINLKQKIEQERNLKKVPWDVIEKDYVLSWILAGMSEVEEIKNLLVFKGGTALKKFYFGDYRYSEDLDFTILDNSVERSVLENLINKACKASQRLMEQTMPSFPMQASLYIEKQPHPKGQVAFVIKTQLPWHRELHVRSLIEITFQETLIYKPIYKKIIHEYEEALSSELQVYPLEEIIIEKVKAILSNFEKLHERGWARSRVRDYYDLWWIFKRYKQDLNLNNFKENFQKKYPDTQGTFSNYQDFFKSDSVAQVESTWGQWLSPLQYTIPSSREVIEDLKESLKEVFPA